MSAKKPDPIKQNSLSPTDTADREMVISRVIDAPRDLVFRAFTDRENISLWWGPNGFRTTTYEMDVRPGGRWRYMMHGPDGVDYPNRVVYLEVIPSERLVYEHSSDVDDDPEQFISTITFESQGETTKVTLRAVFRTVEQHEAHKRFGAIEGGNQTLGRLDAYLTKRTIP